MDNLEQPQPSGSLRQPTLHTEFKALSILSPLEAVSTGSRSLHPRGRQLARCAGPGADGGRSAPRRKGLSVTTPLGTGGICKLASNRVFMTYLRPEECWLLPRWSVGGALGDPGPRPPRRTEGSAKDKDPASALRGTRWNGQVGGEGRGVAGTVEPCLRPPSRSCRLLPWRQGEARGDRTPCGGDARGGGGAAVQEPHREPRADKTCHR